jgi:hypothetical protein
MHGCVRPNPCTQGLSVPSFDEPGPFSERLESASSGFSGLAYFVLQTFLCSLQTVVRGAVMASTGLSGGITCVGQPLSSRVIRFVLSCSRQGLSTSAWRVLSCSGTATL